MSKQIKKILVCNRGEIAIRIFRAATELGIQTVAIYTNEDRFSLHRYKADEAYQVGQAGYPVQSYLDIPAIIKIAKNASVDAIHPGYGFLSEREELERAATAEGIIFIGPTSETLQIAGDKVKTLALARELKIPTVPGSGKINSLADAETFAQSVGFPVIIKASFGGGGRGMRVCRNAEELKAGLEVAGNEAQSAFGRGDLYLEKCLVHPKHIEVQLVGDGSGKVVHLFERDCSVQRRHQKVIEIAPATTISEETRSALYKYALAIGQKLKLRSVATAEFLVDESGAVYFIEVNPRIQVEHTVTEEITGIDLIQTQIRIAEGRTLADLELAQDKLSRHGVAIQCRLTTEDPQNKFRPDTGKLVTYRSASGFGIRLDAGSAFTGAVISPFYDSLLVKVTARGVSLDDASRKLRRCLREFRIRGVTTNLQFLEKLLSHPTFLSGQTFTTFVEETADLFEFAPRRDRANKVLQFIGDVTVNGHHQIWSQPLPEIKRPAMRGQPEVPRIEVAPGGKEISQLRSAGEGRTSALGWRDTLKSEGIDKFLKQIREHKGLLITDTSFRDAHQSLIATRLRTYDMAQLARPLAHNLPGLFSLEMWGGATFDVCLRFLREDPWERLAKLRRDVPGVLFQALFRGDNVVGYSSYPKNVIRKFIETAAVQGIDLFRVFDCFNLIGQMQTTLAAVKEAGALAEGAICYTGNLVEEEAARRSGRPSKFDLRYYKARAKELIEAGADIIAIKDMAGLLRPEAARILISELRAMTDKPLHLHSHDTAGGQIATYLEASRAGVDIVDCAFASVSGVTSQPSMEALVAALEGTERQTGLSLKSIAPFSSYFEDVRAMYQPFEADLKAATGEVYLNEIPGGQYSNLRSQAESVGLGFEWNQVKEAYRQVDRALGRIVKVTPSSKAVGDFALFLVANNLTMEEALERADTLNFPKSVIELVEGGLGVPEGGFPATVVSKILKGKQPKPNRATELPDADLKAAQAEASAVLGRSAGDTDTLSHLIYPHVFKEYAESVQKYGDLSILPTLTYFYGLEEGEEVSVDLEPGKRLFISLTVITDAAKNGERSVMFELNGQSRSASVRDKRVSVTESGEERAEPGNDRQIGAPLSGAVVEVAVKVGDSVEREQKLFTLEAMKMQSVVAAPRGGKIKRIVQGVGSRVQVGDLVLELE